MILFIPIQIGFFFIKFSFSETNTKICVIFLTSSLLSKRPNHEGDCTEPPQIFVVFTEKVNFKDNQENALAGNQMESKSVRWFSFFSNRDWSQKWPAVKKVFKKTVQLVSSLIRSSPRNHESGFVFQEKEFFHFDKNKQLYWQFDKRKSGLVVLASD